VLNNLFGEDRQEAVKVLDDDASFDRWLAEFERQKANEAAEAKRKQRNGNNGGGSSNRNMKTMSKEKFIRDFDVEFK
jgi:hypothetical protein